MAENIYELRAEFFKALSHPTRLKILDVILNEKEICVCEIVNKIGVDQSTISKHLNILKKAGILESKKEGLSVFYKVRFPCMKDYFICIDKTIKCDLVTKVSFIDSSKEKVE
ncbi:MAG: Transcriptional regulator, ArsR family [Caldanaerobacter subterraneus]|jgi:ArsR family transcriptional regulator|uniref:Transcriptional regulator, ArsR family n=5 Tax=Thermoanaerobacteraceae TaxID=186814 RepID=B0K895_THEP3|nr:MULTISPECIES: metalloregulator ArsR/SmtB family transcription factor [Thermoanaerobacteraceae]ABY94408.1 transcriptional regulator, ArsR family [Thermoanaerobacter pseudethanolicus ATCC 33223]ADV79361.1 regulatory protein ArsR [Thermoanaerobacter brockii subsp. finnii Ako-1]KUK09316.1 MAG: Transcriptional regulator, ArsR family [Caldanaerobacter subterraneus]HBT50012.1 ArsR family transcriptional regulator [Caldanaerobacter subterraneus]HBW60038.1 ArsR family transcriptional regulator [Ther